MKEIIKIEELPKMNIFKVPEGYFDTLYTSIQERIAFSEEPVVNFGKKQNFAVPDNYFDTLSSRIMNRIADLEKQEIRLENLPKVNVFKVPQGYFENAEESIRATVRVESIERKNIFEVPASYFHELPGRILSKTQEETKVIKVNWWQKGRTMWAAAASIVLIIGLGLSVPLFSKSDSESAMESLSKDEISSYLATQDLGLLEYEAITTNTSILPKEAETKIIDDLNINKKDILEHLESQDLEEDI
ncbi:hypothetical protein [Emticicia sp. C21]|uniref:hypothetical protein n=1 Tax=Emticicia sp. C21 TaxID=2302915 RepID=UPI000E3556D4|nr:hypothetical protein [Emticicia sp. C21]RFS18094.1 hypothetical protein D0T08_02270 [Emticicia sp. C21]